MPASYHIAQELQKYNIPDYRPRQEQYVFFRLLSYLSRVTESSTKISKGDQESACCATYAKKSRVRVQPDGRSLSTTRSSTPYQGIRHI